MLTGWLVMCCLCGVKVLRVVCTPTLRKVSPRWPLNWSASVPSAGHVSCHGQSNGLDINTAWEYRAASFKIKYTPHCTGHFMSGLFSITSALLFSRFKEPVRNNTLSAAILFFVGSHVALFTMALGCQAFLCLFITLRPQVKAKSFLPDSPLWPPQPAPHICLLPLGVT